MTFIIILFLIIMGDESTDGSTRFTYFGDPVGRLKLAVHEELLGLPTFSPLLLTAALLPLKIFFWISVL